MSTTKEFNNASYVVCFGTPPSATLRKGVAGAEYASSLVELNRLCLADNRPNEAYPK